MARRRRRPSTGDGGQLANGSRPAIISLWWWLSRCCQTGFGYVFCCCCCSCCVTGKWASFNQVGWYHARQGGRKSSVSVGQRDKRDSSRVQTIASRVDRQERDRLFKGRKTSWNWCTFIKWKRKKKRRKKKENFDNDRRREWRQRLHVFPSDSAVDFSSRAQKRSRFHFNCT